MCIINQAHYLYQICKVKFEWNTIDKSAIHVFFNVTILHSIFLFVGKNCAEFNFGGSRIQRNRNMNCSKCPMTYASINSFQCKICVIGVSALLIFSVRVLNITVTLYILVDNYLKKPPTYLSVFLSFKIESVIPTRKVYLSQF